MSAAWHYWAARTAWITLNLNCATTTLGYCGGRLDQLEGRLAAADTIAALRWLLTTAGNNACQPATLPELTEAFSAAAALRMLTPESDRPRHVLNRVSLDAPTPDR
jgi:hypothetical protein